MDALTLLYIIFIAVGIILAIYIFIMNENCKKQEELTSEVIEELETTIKLNAELIDENKQLKARLLYERTKDDANVF